MMHAIWVVLCLFGWSCGDAAASPQTAESVVRDATAVQGTSLENIVYLPARESSSPGRAVVRTEVRVAGADIVSIHYYMRMRQGRWLVYDVKVEGISLVTNYRASFGAEIRHSGVQGLIDHMKQKNRRPAWNR